jgi:hypothetical protein
MNLDPAMITELLPSLANVSPSVPPAPAYRAFDIEPRFRSGPRPVTFKAKFRLLYDHSVFNIGRPLKALEHWFMVLQSSTCRSWFVVALVSNNRSVPQGLLSPLPLMRLKSALNIQGVPP